MPRKNLIDSMREEIKKAKPGTPAGWRAGLGGHRIRSRGEGRGLGIGKGAGPVGRMGKRK